MLFNTLGYAQFLALVFVVSWALVLRRRTLWLPLLPLLAFSVVHPTPRALALGAASLLVTLGLSRLQRRVSLDAPPAARVALLQLTLQTAALGSLTYGKYGLDPFSYGLTLLRVPVEALHGFRWPLAAGLFFCAYLLIVHRKSRLLFLLLASYVFYAHWDYRFLPLIWGSSTADYFLARRISQEQEPKSRKRWLLGTVIINLGVLGFFKYFNFGIDAASAVLSSLGMSVPEVTLRVALPVGISFFTFESMSYVIDVYRREIEPQKSYLEYLSFVAFFPHLVAGPIVRPRDLLPQLAGEAKFSPTLASEGLFLIAVGLSKKIIIGDYLALNLIDRVFDAPYMYSALEVYAATVGYALQIYCDFSGYTDIAIGSALLLGIRFPLNFDSPYKAHNIIDFWRRWHISLSTWLRDYLYIPLGGNRKGRARTYVNLLVTMVLGGLWHGAAWTFVAWGLLHGAALALTKWWQETRSLGRSDRKEEDERKGALAPLTHAAAVLFTFHVVLVGWIFFRADSFAKAESIFSRLATLSTHHPNLPPTVLGILALGMVSHFMPDRWFSQMKNRFCQSSFLLQAVCLLVVSVALRKMVSAEAVPFVYFQF